MATSSRGSGLGSLCSIVANSLVFTCCGLMTLAFAMSYSAFPQHLYAEKNLAIVYSVSKELLRGDGSGFHYSYGDATSRLFLAGSNGYLGVGRASHPADSSKVVESAHGFAGVWLKSYGLPPFRGGCGGAPRDSQAQAMLATWDMQVTVLVLPLAYGVAAFSAWSLLSVTRFWCRHRARRRKGRCLCCGYNLHMNVSGVCPECGRETTPAAE